MKNSPSASTIRKGRITVVALGLLCSIVFFHLSTNRPSQLGSQKAEHATPIEPSHFTQETTSLDPRLTDELVPWPKATGPQPTQRFFKEEATALTIDPTRIAVRIQSEDPSQTISQSFPDASADPHPLPGWKYVDLSQLWNKAKASGKWNENDFSRTLVEAATQHPQIDYAAPVFLDFRNDPLLPQQAILIGIAPGTSEERALEIAALGGAYSKAEFLGPKKSDLYLEYPIQDGFEILQLAQDLSGFPEIRYAEADMLMTGRIPASVPLEAVNPEGAEINLGEVEKPDFTTDGDQWGEADYSIPNDPLFTASGGWGLDNTGQSGGLSGFDMDALSAWDYTTGSSSVIAVVIDNGIQASHPDLNQWSGNGKDFTPDSSSSPNGEPVTANDKHGTAVAGCISGKINNGIGASGIAPGVQVASARPHYNGTSSGSFSTSYSWVVNAINWAETIGAKVTVNSNSYGSVSSSVSSAYSSTRDAGITHFGSAGNSGNGSISFPSSASAVISVGASQRDGTKSSFSQYGTGLAFLAPGTSVTTTDRTGSAGYSSSDYATVNGTSFSAPYACGVAALLYSYNSSITPDEVTAALESGCVDMGSAGYDTTNGYGHLSAANALELIGISASASSINSKIRLQWTDPANSGMASSTIYIRYSTSAFPANSTDGSLAYSGTATEFEHTGLTPGQTYYYTFWGNDGSSYASFGTDVQVSQEAVDAATLVFMYNSSTRYIETWIVDETGACITKIPTYSSPMSSGWLINTAADVDGDGLKDLVFENTSSKMIANWILDEYGQRVSAAAIHDQPMSNGWRLVGAADLSSDGIDDLIFQNTSSRLVAKWLLDNTGTRASASMVDTNPVSAGWTIVAIADLNGDGIKDLLFENTQSRKIAKWLLNASGERASGSLVHSSPMSTGWAYAGSGDLNGDGINDIIFQNSSDRRIANWMLDSSGTRASAAAIHPAGTSSGWVVVGSEDLDGDGDDDLIFENAPRGVLANWILDSDGVRESATLLYPDAHDTNWGYAAHAKN